MSVIEKLKEFAASVWSTLTWIIGLIGYIIGLTLAFVVGIPDLFECTTIPSFLVGSHPIYSLIRGALDALFASSIAWCLWLWIGMAYLQFSLFILNFFGVAKE